MAHESTTTEGRGWRMLALMPRVLTQGPPAGKSTAVIPRVGRVHYEGRTSETEHPQGVIGTDDMGGVYWVQLTYWLGWPK